MDIVCRFLAFFKGVFLRLTWECHGLQALVSSSSILKKNFTHQAIEFSTHVNHRAYFWLVWVLVQVKGSDMVMKVAAKVPQARLFLLHGDWREWIAVSLTDFLRRKQASVAFVDNFFHPIRYVISNYRVSSVFRNDHRIFLCIRCWFETPSRILHDGLIGDH